MAASAIKTINYFGLKPCDCAWLCLPIGYIAGKMMVVRSIVGNLNLLVSEPSGTPCLPDQVVDFSAMVPMQVFNLLEKKTDFTHIKKLIIGGASISFSLLNRLKDIPSEVFASYGMTETCSHIALKRINGINPEEAFHLLPGITISKNDKECLVIYAHELSDSLIQTNDRVEIITPRQFHWIGRVDHVINSGGIKISPEPLEEDISKFLGQECLIVPEKDAKIGQKMVLVLEKSSNLTSNLVLSILNKQFKNRLYPRDVFFINTFPRNQSLKIDRLAVISYLEKKKNQKRLSSGSFSNTP